MKMTNTVFLVLGVVGLVLIGVSQALVKDSVRNVQSLPVGPLGVFLGREGPGQHQADAAQKASSVIVGLLAHLLVAVGGAFFAVGRNRSPWFGLLGLLTPIGLLFLAVLEDRSGVRESTP